MQIQETRGQICQVTDWKSPEEDIIQLECEGRGNATSEKPMALQVIRITLLFNILMLDHRDQLDRTMTNLGIAAGPLVTRLNELKGKYIEIKSVQGILKQ